MLCFTACINVKDTNCSSTNILNKKNDLQAKFVEYTIRGDKPESLTSMFSLVNELLNCTKKSEQQYFYLQAIKSKLYFFEGKMEDCISTIELVKEFDKVNMLAYQGYILEVQNKTNEALQKYKQSHKLCLSENQENCLFTKFLIDGSYEQYLEELKPQTEVGFEYEEYRHMKQFFEQSNSLSDKRKNLLHSIYIENFYLP